MAIFDFGRMSDAATGFSGLPVSKQIFILFALSLTIALGVYVAFWSQKPDLIPLYANLNSKELHQITESLSKHKIYHKFEPGAGILVPVNEVHTVRMKLASEGLPKGASGIGYELLDQPQSFTTSQFMENVRYRRSIEGELAKTISSLDAVRDARVHLGLPRQSSFLKNKIKSSASVMLDLYPGHNLDLGQIMGIVHLVSSSISGLNYDDVTVIDQRGNLLSTQKGSTEARVAMEEFNYIRQVESELSAKIQEILVPLYGVHSVRAQVAVSGSFTNLEVTKENFDKKPIIRSESIVTEQKDNSGLAVGIPGALSNQPPTTTVGEAEEGEEDEADNLFQANNNAVNYIDHKTRNYELNRTITHQKNGVWNINKISVAVVINDKASYGTDGKTSYTPLTEEELEEAELLVKDAVGFNEKRGDTVSIVNSQFAAAPPVVIDDEKGGDSMQLLKQPWVTSLLKQSLGALFILFLLFTIVKPMIKVLSEFKPEKEVKTEEEKAEQTHAEISKAVLDSQAKVEHVKQIAHSDSKKTAQVVMNWVGAEDEQ